MRKVWILALLLAPLALFACRSQPPGGRVILLGIDGLDPEVIDLLMAEGKLPHFAKMRQEGAYGRLISAKPLLSPIIWTTIATGKTPDQHQIGHFVAVNEKTGEQLPVTSQMRKTKAVWNIASEAGKRVGVVGWWATWPAEKVRGTIVSDHTCYHFLFEDGVRGAADQTGIVSPPGAQGAIERRVRRPGDLTLDDVRPYVTVTAEEFARPFAFEDDLSHFKWALATAETYDDIGRFLWERERPDLLMVYVEGTDSASHLFGHLFRAEGLAGELAEQQSKFGRTVEAMYEYADRLVGRYMQIMDRHTTLMVISDHGFELGVLPDDPSKLRDMRRVSERFHRIEGIIYMYGQAVKTRSRLERPSILDVTPTVLQLLGVPPAADMPGRVVAEGLDVAVSARSVASYDDGPVAVAAAARDPSVDPAILEHLRSLGYLDAQSPKGERNLAAIHFEQGRYAEAARAFEELVEEHPGDGSLHASLAGAYGALGRYDEALAVLAKAQELEPLNPETYHNRGVIFERKGNVEAAVREYRNAVRYQPEYEPSRAALVRLTGSVATEPARSDAERLAIRLATRAGAAARRGDYAEAMKELDEAERTAPELAIVYQYRANVAFLMNDREAARAALRRALEIEPDNALYRANLRHLEGDPTVGAAPTP